MSSRGSIAISDGVALMIWRKSYVKCPDHKSRSLQDQDKFKNTNPVPRLPSEMVVAGLKADPCSVLHKSSRDAAAPGSDSPQLKKLRVAAFPS